MTVAKRPRRNRLERPVEVTQRSIKSNRRIFRVSYSSDFQYLAIIFFIRYHKTSYLHWPYW